MIEYVDICGEMEMVTVTKLRHGFRTDAMIRVGAKRKHFRARGKNLAVALDDLWIAVRRARDALVVRRARAAGGLRLVESS